MPRLLRQSSAGTTIELYAIQTQAAKRQFSSREGTWHDLRYRKQGMSLCASCGLQLSGDAGLCPHHHCVYGDDWAVANRIMCDFFHRKKVPPRLAQTERDDDFWAHTGEAA
jgi:hypothetical protein